MSKHDSFVMRWRDTKVTVPCDGDRVIGFWAATVPGGNKDWSVVEYYSGRWYNPENDEDDYRAPDFWMPLPHEPEASPSAAVDEERKP